MEEYLSKAKERGIGNTGAEKRWLSNLYTSLEESWHCRDSKEESLSNVALETVEKILKEYNGMEEEDISSHEIPITYNIISVKTLMQSHNLSCCSSLKISSKEQKRVVRETSVDGHKPLDRINCLLIGKLTATPRTNTPTEKDKCGDLYLEDGTGALLCQCLDIDVAWLDQYVIALEWNYIPSDPKQKGNSYLEISEMCPQGCEPSPKAKHGLPVVPSKLAQHILQHRDAYSIKLIDLHGAITALSPVHRIRDSVMFFVEITSKDSHANVCLVVKGAEFAHWHHFIQINEEYAFTNVSPTTLNKGSANSFLVYAFTRKSRLSKISREDCRITTLWELKEKFTIKKVQTSGSAVGGDAIDKDGCHGDQEPGPSKKEDDWSLPSSESQFDSYSRRTNEETLSSYQGTITKVTNAGAGIYELDDKIRLYICHQPCASKGRGMRVGAKVNIYSCHFKTFKQAPCLRMCCCTLSSVVIVKFSPLATPYQPFICQQSVFIHLLFFYHLNLVNYQWMVDAAEEMKEKFLPSHLSNSVLMGVQLSRQRVSSDRKTFGVFYNLLRIPSPSTQQLLLPQADRNIYREFMDPQHPCSVMESQSSSRANLFGIATIEKLKAVVKKKSSRAETWQVPESVSPHNTKALNEALYWKHQIYQPKDFKPTMLLVGYLEANSQTGHLQLVDQTGSIDCIIADHSGPLNKHTCTDECHYPTMGRDTPFHCPYVKTWCQGQLLRLDRYQIVTECFTISKFPSVQHVGDSVYIDKSHIRCYLQFSMSDAVSLHRKQNQHRKAEKRKLGDERAGTSDDKQGQCASDIAQSTDVVQLLVVAHKNSLHLSQVGRTQDNPSNLCCQIAVTFLDSTKVVQSDRTNLLQEVDTASQMLRGGNGLDVNIGIQGSTAGSVCDQQKGTDEVDQTQSCGATRTTNLNVKQVVLMLGQECIKWCNLLEVGHTYALIKPSSKDLSVFQAQLPTAALQRAVSITDCRTSVSVSADMIFMPAVCQSAFKQTDCSMLAKLPDQVFVMNADETQLRDRVSARLSCKQANKIQTVHDVMKSSSTSDTSHQVSVKCRVISRTFYTPDSKFRSIIVDDSDAEKVTSLGVSTLDNRAVRLLVGDLSSPDTLFIYLDLDRISYPLALLPGAIVTFRYLNKCTSRKSNIYCQYVANSSVTIEKLPSLGDAPVSNNDAVSHAADSSDNSDLSKLPRRYLCEYVQQRLCNTDRAHQVVSRIHAHIVMVQHISLRYSCAGCGDAFQGGQCRNKCNAVSSKSAVFQAKASFIIDDGTFEARVHCNSDQVASLLDLSTQQWQRLQEYIYQSGEAVHRHRGNEYSVESEHYGRISPAERMLQKLCTSQHVCRPIILYCKQFHQHSNPGFRSAQNSNEYQIRTCDVGERQYQTKFLPPISLFCISLESMDFKAVGKQLMSEVSS
ncbi:CST complex subunit CTC1-like [Ptychodera flava]|uniref:CST complex subunit CTC1-like n=1 Tax=Ptychodera flava TaxID=63121 RepID=UPI00396A1D18